MDYTYFLEGLVNKHIYTNEIYDEENKGTILCILCYHVTETSKYPFIQFMMEKIPYCNNLIKEQFILRSLMGFISVTIILFLLGKKLLTYPSGI